MMAELHLFMAASLAAYGGKWGDKKFVTLFSMLVGSWLRVPELFAESSEEQDKGTKGSVGNWLKGKLPPHSVQQGTQHPGWAGTAL